MRKPSSPLVVESLDLTRESSGLLAEEGGRASAAGTRSTWRERMDLSGPAWDSQCSVRRGSRARRPGDRSS